MPADHPLKDRETVDFSEALEYEFVTFDRDFAMQKFLYEKADEIGRVLKSRLEVEDPLILLRLVSEGYRCSQSQSLYIALSVREGGSGTSFQLLGSERAQNRRQ